jgi:hypothetical protein
VTGGRRGEVPSDPAGQARFEAERHLAAEQTERWLLDLAAMIPEAPPDAGELRRLLLRTAEAVRQAFDPDHQEEAER